MADTHKLDAENLKHMDARLTALAPAPQDAALESVLRAMQLIARIRRTIKELEALRCPSVS